MCTCQQDKTPTVFSLPTPTPSSNSAASDPLNYQKLLNQAALAQQRERKFWADHAADLADREYADAFEEFEPHAFELAVWETVDNLAELLISKQADYGPRAIADAPGGALNGINVRLHDKLSRAINLADVANEDAINHESLVDTYRDLANYAVIASLVLAGEWPA